MKRLFLKNKFRENNSLKTFFGIGEKYLDVNTMRYRVFGAVWQLENGYRYISGYWFCDTKKEVINHIHLSGWTNLVHKDGEIEDVYYVIREKQEGELWKKHIKCPKNETHQEKWRGAENGWYILRSRKHFPCTLTCVRKTKYDIWIEHICVCESNNDIKKYINLMNLEHNINLIADEWLISDNVTGMYQK